LELARKGTEKPEKTSSFRNSKTTSAVTRTFDPTTRTHLNSTA
jgi:hypothetical protein